MVDYDRPEIFDLDRGLLKWPVDVPQPFAPDPTIAAAYFESNVTSDPAWTYASSTYLNEHQAPKLYSPELADITNRSSYAYFQLVSTHAAVSSSFSLGASNIQEGSETVTLDGKTLTKGTDYEIDYTFGEITLKGEAASLNAGQPDLRDLPVLALLRRRQHQPAGLQPGLRPGPRQQGGRPPGCTRPSPSSARRPSWARSPARPWWAT